MRRATTPDQIHPPPVVQSGHYTTATEQGIRRHTSGSPADGPPAVQGPKSHFRRHFEERGIDYATGSTAAKTAHRWRCHTTRSPRCSADTQSPDLLAVCGYAGTGNSPGRPRGASTLIQDAGRHPGLQRSRPGPHRRPITLNRSACRVLNEISTRKQLDTGWGALGLPLPVPSSRLLQ